MGTPVDKLTPQELPTLLTAIVEMGADGHYRVRTRDGRLIRARCDESVSPQLVDVCIRERRRMLIERDGNDMFIVGALQTTLESVASRVTVEAEDELILRSGNSSISLRADGKVSLRGNHLTMDVARLVKLLSAKVELP